MTLDIRAGMFAVLRAGIVPEWPIHRGHTLKWYWMLHDDCYLVSGHWLESKKPHPRDIVATFANRAEALAYVADNPMNRELYPDGPDLASVPVTVPMDPGDFIGDIYYGDPIKTTMGTHRWDGKQWVQLPTEVEALCGLLAKARAAPAPVVVDWKARAEALSMAAMALREIAVEAIPELEQCKEIHALDAALAAAKEPRHE